MEQSNLKNKVARVKKSIVSDNLERILTFHPIVILDRGDGVIYYLKCSGYSVDSKKFKNDVIIVPKDVKKPQNVISKDSLVDCTKIYEMNETEFNYFFSDNKLNISDLYLLKIKQIYESLYQNLNQQPPMIGLIQSKKHPQFLKTTFYTLYSHQDLLDNDWNNITRNQNITDTDKFKNLYNEILNVRNQNLETLDYLEEIKNWVNEKIELTNDRIYQLENKRINKQKDEKGDY